MLYYIKMSDVIKTKKKRVMTPEMLENLKKARERAMEVRNRLKLSEVEQIKHAKAKIQQKSTESALSKRARIKALAEAELIAEKEKIEVNDDVKEEVTEEIKEIKEKIKEPEPAEEAKEEPVDPPKKAKEVKKKEKKIKYVYESETSEEEEIIVVKKKKNKPKQQEQPEQQQYQEPPIIPFVMKQGPISGRRGGRIGFY